MNYITEINRFYDWLETNPISDSAIVLWHALIHINNKCGWKEEYNVAIATLQLKTGLSKSSIIRARKTLQEVGRINFYSREGQQSAVYSIIPCHTDTQSKTQTVTQTVTQSETQTDPQTVTIPKLNKTKLNKTKQPLPKLKKVLDKKNTTLHWQKLVDTWFIFYNEKFKIDPTFSPGAASHFKKILDRLHTLTMQTPGAVYSEELAVKVLTRFLVLAHQDKWLQDNFLLANLYTQFDKIVKPESNGKQKTGAGVDTAQAFAKIDSYFS